MKEFECEEKRDERVIQSRKNTAEERMKEKKNGERERFIKHFTSALNNKLNS